MTARRDLLARLEQARQLEPPLRSAALYEVGRALLLSGDPAAGRAGREALVDGAADEPWAAYGAALLLLRGEHGPQDITRAIELLERAAPTVAEAALLLAQLLGGADRGRAEAVLAPWAAAGLPAGLSRLGQLHAFHGDDVAAEGPLRHAASLGDVDGMFELSLLLGRRREAEAAEWERRAADLGHGRACLNAGARLQAAGRDSVEGAALYRRAAEFGVAEAAARLAVMHLRESGLPRDEVEAERWYLRALELGFSGPLPGAQ